MQEADDMRRFEVPEDARGRRLDQVLLELVGGYSRTKLQALIKDGRVRLSGAVVTKPGAILLEGGALEVDLRPSTAEGANEFEDSALHVVFSDEALIVIDKPAGMLSHRNSSHGEKSAADLAVARFGPLPSVHGEDRPGIAHRLDRETSGLLILGRTEDALADLKRQFQERLVQKTYLALVHGDPRFDTQWIEGNLGRSEKARDRISIVPEGEGRFASTYFEVRERFRGFALLAVFPKTGRMHQVRVHLGSIGLPLIGERLYRPRNPAPKSLPKEAPAMSRQALHAHMLEFAHPVSKQPLRFESPLPPDMLTLRDWLQVNLPE